MNEKQLIEQYLRKILEPVVRKTIDGQWADIEDKYYQIHYALCQRYRALGEDPQRLYELMHREEKAILEWEQENESIL